MFRLKIVRIWRIWGDGGNLRDTRYLKKYMPDICFYHLPSGVLLHYDDPLLRDLYFLDPQWLCDMLAHVVTIREVNPHINNGKHRLRDMRII